MHLVDMSRQAYMGRALEALGADVEAHSDGANFGASICLSSAALILQADSVTVQGLAGALGYCVAAESMSKHEAMLAAVAPLTEWMELEISEAVRKVDHGLAN